MSKVTIYSTPTCTYCQLAKQFFGENNVQYEESAVVVQWIEREPPKF
jgi:arsenate reductase-like glutaredoxin family protein